MKELVLFIVVICANAQLFKKVTHENIFSTLLSYDAKIRDIEEIEAAIKQDIEYDKHKNELYLTNWDHFALKRELNDYKKQLKSATKSKKANIKLLRKFFKKAPKDTQDLFVKKYGMEKRLGIPKRSKSKRNHKK